MYQVFVLKQFNPLTNHRWYLLYINVFALYIYNIFTKSSQEILNKFLKAKLCLNELTSNE
jgi:hypothetical protein